MKFVALLGLFALASGLITDHQYNIQVFLGDTYFEPVKGTLKLLLDRGFPSKDKYRLSESRLETRRSYTSWFQIPSTIDEIQKATFYWTLSSPYPPKYISSKPSIYLKQVKVIPIYIQNEQFRESESRYFCPVPSPVKIKHREEVQLRRC